LTAPVLVLLITVLVWFVTRRDTKLAAVTALGLLLIWNLNLWDLSMLTLALVITSTILALAIAIPLGIAAARSETLNAALRPVLDFMQTMPSFVYLIPAVIFFGLGSVPAIIATVIFAMPPALRLTNLGIRQVPGELIEVADAFGTTPRQKLFKVQLPVALPTIMAGVNQCIMLALSMTVIASMIGAGGLGYQVLVGIQRVDIGMGFEAGLAIVIIAVILDRITQNVVPPQQEDR
jgi:glycine betaine/proline transport system permease protein